MALCVGLAPALALAQGSPVTPITPELQISPAGYDYAPALATTEGGFLVVWKQGGTPPGSPAPKVVVARRFDESGAPTGDAIPISLSPLSDYSRVSVATTAAGGGALAVWQRSDTGGVAGRRLAGSGRPVGPEIAVSPTGRLPRVAALGRGRFVVVWMDSGAGPSLRILGQTYSPAGTPEGPVFPVSVQRGWTFQALPAVAVDGQGNFVVVWERENEGLRTNFAGRLFGPDSVPRSGEIQLVAPARFSGQPAVAFAPDGGFTVVWIRGGAVFGERFDASGHARGPAVPISAAPGESRVDPGITFDAAGRSVVYWYRSKEPQAVGQVLDADGRAQGGHFLFAPFGVTNSTLAAAFLPDGDLVGIWGRPGPNGSAAGFIDGRVYRLAAP